MSPTGTLLGLPTFEPLWQTSCMTANIGEPQTTAPPAPQGRIPADTFSARLLLSRHLAGMTIKEAAERCGINDATWATWERGRRPQDKVEVCEAVAEALDINFTWLLIGGHLLGPRGRLTERAERTRATYPSGAVRADRDSARPGGGRPNGRADQHPVMLRAAGPRRAARVG